MKRIPGVDAARTIAILGMLILHIVPSDAISDTGWLPIFVDDSKPQMLFALIDGISLGFLSAYGDSRPMRSGIRRSIAARGIYLIALGLILTQMSSGVIVILDYYGFFFLVVLPLLFLRPVLLLLSGVLLTLAGPHIVQATLGLRLEDPEAVPSALRQIDLWLLTGQYPGVVWIGLILIGLWIQRIGLSNNRWNARAGTVSLGLWAVASLVRDGLPEPVRASLDPVIAGLLAAGVVWILVALCSLARGRSARLLYGLVSMGAMPLSVYSLHVILISLIGDGVGIGNLQSWGTFGAVLTCCIVAATTWRIFRERGPLESISALLANGARSATVSYHDRKKAFKTASNSLD